MQKSRGEDNRNFISFFSKSEMAGVGRILEFRLEKRFIGKLRVSLGGHEVNHRF